jgi:hypothetical protein
MCTSLEKGNLSLFPEKVSHSCSQKVPTHLGKRCLILFPVVRCYPRVSLERCLISVLGKGVILVISSGKVSYLLFSEKVFPRTQERPSPGVHSEGRLRAHPSVLLPLSCTRRAVLSCNSAERLVSVVHRKGRFVATRKGVLSHPRKSTVCRADPEAFYRALGKGLFTVTKGQ